jgi:hypothetical protein
MNDVSYERHYIYENISKIKNHNNIINYLKRNKCKYTENKNGIFVNLNTVSDEQIHNLYILTKNTMENFLKDDYSYTAEIVSIENECAFSKEIPLIEVIINHNDILMNQFSNDEQKIINYSKLYL